MTEESRPGGLASRLASWIVVRVCVYMYVYVHVCW